jgi:hypothetical protein
MFEIAFKALGSEASKLPKKLSRDIGFGASLTAAFSPSSLLEMRCDENGDARASGGTERPDQLVAVPRH